MDPAHPHDSLFQEAFGEPADAATLLRSALPAAVAAAVDWTTLQRVDATFVDAGRRDRESDLLFTARMGDREVLVYVLVEHKSGQDRRTVLQMAGYVLRIWEHCFDRRPRPRALPPVLPIVFHHGARPWRAPRTLRALVEVRGVPPAVARFVLRHQPQLRLLFDDVAAQSDEMIEQRQLSLVARVSVLFLKHLRRADVVDLERHLARVRDLLARLLEDPRGSSMLAALCFYAIAASRRPEQAGAVLRRALGPETAGAMMNGLQKLLSQARNDGLSEGRVALLLAQLQAKFGPLPDDVVPRVRAGAPDEVERWSLRILAATSLDEVFALG